MAQQLLTLPVDIQWKRLCFSQDMSTIDLNALPPRWRSSLAVFYFDPEPDETDPAPDEKVTYLKVVASITGLQPEAPELDPALSSLPSWNHEAIGNIAGLTQSYYAAYAAIVQVGVAPKGL